MCRQVAAGRHIAAPTAAANAPPPPSPLCEIYCLRPLATGCPSTRSSPVLPCRKTISHQPQNAPCLRIARANQPLKRFCSLLPVSHRTPPHAHAPGTRLSRPCPSSHLGTFEDNRLRLLMSSCPGQPLSPAHVACLDRRHPSFVVSLSDITTRTCTCPPHPSPLSHSISGSYDTS